ncbi:MAG: T9SS type A sorting domain-containing protein [Bacteroidota bacterium]
MKKIITFLLIIAGFYSYSQNNNTIFGIVRQNYYSNLYNPVDSSIIGQQFDSASLRLGTINPISGYVSNTGSFAFNEAINLTGASLNPYENSFVFIGANNINTLSLSNGSLTNSTQLTNPNGQGYFDNFRFNNADSIMYGLSRRNYTNPNTGQTTGAVYLAKANTTTGLITEISTSPVAQGFALAGSVIDPHQMVYYFSTGSNLMGLDIYDGSIFSNVPFINPNGIAFDNFTYSCADSSIYGLIRQNYFTYVLSDFFPNDSIQQFDSSTIRLGKINPSTGLVTAVSPFSIASGGYSLNAGSTIDPDGMIYYFGNGQAIIGVSLITGLVVSNQSYSFENGMYFDLMRNNQNCITARAERFANFATTIVDKNEAENFSVYPNPSSGVFTFKDTKNLNSVEVYSILGEKILSQTNQKTINLSGFSKGIYFARVNGMQVVKLVKE